MDKKKKIDFKKVNKRFFLLFIWIVFGIIIVDFAINYLTPKIYFGIIALILLYIVAIMWEGEK